MKLTQHELARVEKTASNKDHLAGMIGIPFADWAGRCHEISLALLRTKLFGPGRIARGTCEHVLSQHSWIVLGSDCYARDATVVDPTLWAHDPDVTGIYVGTNRTGYYHQPHGAGSCLSAGMPSWHDGPFIELTPSKPLGPRALAWLGILGPLDLQGWAEVAHLPVENWPAGEIIEAMTSTRELAGLLPIDILGMATDLNPGDLYW